MKKVAALLFAGMLGAAVQVSAQAPVAAPAQPKASTTPKTGTAAKTGAVTPRAYERVLLRPALLKEKAPATYQV